MSRLGWAASSAYRSGPFAVGVRTDGAALDERLRAVLAAHVLGRDGLPANYSLRVSVPAREGGRQLAQLYWGNSLVRVTRSTRRAVDALLAHLHALTLVDRRDRPCVEGFVVVRGGRAVLGPAGLHRASSRLHARLRAAGAAVVDAPVVALDGDVVVVEEPALAIDRDALDALGAHDPRDPTRVPPGRYPVTGWFLRTGRPDGAELPRASALLRAVGLVVNRPALPGQALLDDLARFVTAAGPRPARDADMASGLLSAVMRANANPPPGRAAAGGVSESA